MVFKTPKKEPYFQQPLPLSNFTTNSTNPNISPNPSTSLVPPPCTGEESVPTAAMELEGSPEDEALRSSEALARGEVLRRRSRRLRQLAAYYRRHYWALVEEVKVKHRDYYWEYGESPFERNEEEELGLGFGESGERKKCAFAGCKSKAMPLTRFCVQHILSDPKQTLYKPCNFVIKSSVQTGQITCNKPVLKGANPSLCHIHYQKSQKGIAQALKKAGIITNLPSSSSSCKPVPKLSLLIAESVRQIQSKRQQTLVSSKDK